MPLVGAPGVGLAKLTLWFQLAKIGSLFPFDFLEATVGRGAGPRFLCHRKCNDRVRTRRAGRVRTRSAEGGLSAVSCGFCWENREFCRSAVSVFKSTALD